MSPTMASAATAAPVQSISPLIAVSVFGTQASAQQVCAGAASSAAAAGAAVSAQGQPGCVLPATDAPPQVGETPPIQPTAAPRGFSITPVLLGLIGIAALAALIASGNGDSDSPSSPS
jgi:hypothetical protein